MQACRMIDFLPFFLILVSHDVFSTGVKVVMKEPLLSILFVWFTAVNRVYRRGGCRSDLGIAKMRELFKRGRKGVPKTGILITDGDPQEAYKSQAEASAAYQEGVNLFLVGMCKLYQWFQPLFRCRIELLIFLMGFNIIAPYVEMLHINRSLHHWYWISCISNQGPSKASIIFNLSFSHSCLDKILYVTIGLLVEPLSFLFSKWIRTISIKPHVWIINTKLWDCSCLDFRRHTID